MISVPKGFMAEGYKPDALSHMRLRTDELAHLLPNAVVITGETLRRSSHGLSHSRRYSILVGVEKHPDNELYAVTVRYLGKRRFEITYPCQPVTEWHVLLDVWRVISLLHPQVHASE